jgi:hypothetical protein
MQEGNSSIIWYGPPDARTVYVNGTEVNPRLSSVDVVGNHTIGEYNLQYSLTTFDAGVYSCDMIHEGGERFQGFRDSLVLTSVPFTYTVLASGGPYHIILLFPSCIIGHHNVTLSPILDFIGIT